MHVGNFVEVKNAALGESSKANHLTYIGDSRIGRDVNVGAGVVTCNYDGANKHTTVIEDNVFIGSGTMLVALDHRPCRGDDRGGLNHREGCAARCPDGDPGTAKDLQELAAARASAEKLRSAHPSPSREKPHMAGYARAAKGKPRRSGAFGPASKPGRPTLHYIIRHPPHAPRRHRRSSSFFGFSATVASVVISNPAIDAAFCNAVRTTFVGSRIPIFTKSPYSSVCALNP